MCVRCLLSAGILLLSVLNLFKGPNVCLFVFLKLVALTTYFPFPQFVSGGVRHRGQDEQAHPPDGLQDACASVHGEKPADRRGQRL